MEERRVGAPRYGVRVDGYAFLSYRHASDREYVERLASFLTRAGVNVWHDSAVVTGDRWERIIKAKVDGCAALVVVMTPGAEESDWVNREITQAEELGRPILPLLLDGTRFFRLSNIQFEDVRDGRLPARRFVDRLRHLVRSPTDENVDQAREMVVSLVRRNQVVVHHLVDSLRTLEFHESDATRRKGLAEVRATAESLRRSDERLLIVANDESARRTGHQTARLERVLVAQAEERSFRTIEFPHIDRDIVIVDGAIHDIGLMVGELLDNSIAFSPPTAPVVVEARRYPDGATVLIRDTGIGIKPEMLKRLNERLSTPPLLDVEVLRQMGLAVVASLAHRHGLIVQLSPNGEQGICAEITLPTGVITGTAGRDPRLSEIPPRVVRAGIAALPRTETEAVLENLPRDQVRVILAGLAAERAEAILNQGRTPGWPVRTDAPRIDRPGLPSIDETSPERPVSDRPTAEE